MGEKTYLLPRNIHTFLRGRVCLIEKHGRYFSQLRTFSVIRPFEKTETWGQRKAGISPLRWNYLIVLPSCSCTEDPINNLCNRGYFFDYSFTRKKLNIVYPVVYSDRLVFIYLTKL